MDNVSDTATKACAACKKYKRKCDKVLPSCSTCLSVHRVCDYSIPDSTRPGPEEEITLLQTRVEELEKLVEKSVTANTVALTPSLSTLVTRTCNQIQAQVPLSLIFLDERFSVHIHSSRRAVSVPVPNDIMDVLKEEYSQPQGMTRLVSQYFDTVHGWMPIISKMRMRRVLDRSGQNIQADTAFLLACMKLLLHTPQIETVPEDLWLYRIVKSSHLQLEIAGLQSLMTIQGGILITVYELGQGIFPACYTTVAQCARQAISAGIHDRKGPQNFEQWTDWEEQIRVWWFIVMLDRHVTVGRQLRPLCTEDPKIYAPLPSDSVAWDQGALVTPERLYTSSPASRMAGPYTRLAQAFHLLGRVIRHCDYHDQDIDFILEEMCTLHQAISALLELTTNEGSGEDSYVATAVCFSSLMKLHKDRLSDSFIQGLTNINESTGSQLASRIRKCTEKSYQALRTVDFAQSLERRIMVSGVDKLSPLVLHCVYRAAFWLSHLAAATREERFLAGRSICDRVLKALSLRWKVADIYLQILKTAREEIEWMM